jgi:hypothetical protein
MPARWAARELDAISLSQMPVLKQVMRCCGQVNA